MSVLKVLTFVLVTLCVFLAGRANLQPNNAKNIEDIIMGWGDKIFSAVKKFDEFIDFEKLNQIIDATIEEDCFPEDCPLGNTEHFLKLQIVYEYIHNFAVNPHLQALFHDQTPVSHLKATAVVHSVFRYILDRSYYALSISNCPAFSLIIVEERIFAR